MSRVGFAQQQLFTNSALTEELTDEAAEALLSWAVEQLTVFDAEAPDDATFNEWVTELGNVMKGVNTVVNAHMMQDSAAAVQAMALLPGAPVISAQAAAEDTVDSSAMPDVALVNMLLKTLRPVHRRAAPAGDES